MGADRDRSQAATLALPRSRRALPLTLFVAVTPVARPSVYHHHDVRAAHIHALLARQHRAGVRPRPRRVRFQPRQHRTIIDDRRQGDPRGI